MNNRRKNKLTKRLFATLLSSLTVSCITDFSKSNKALIQKIKNEKLIENNNLDHEKKSSFQRFFLTIDGEKIEIGSKGSSKDFIVILHAFGCIPELDIEIPNGETEIPAEYVQLSKKSKNLNNDYIRDFEQLTNELSKEYKVIVINRFGYGNSDDTEKKRTGEKIAEEIHSVINQLNLKNPLLLAHSMGGLFALSYIKQYPNDISGYIGLDACTPTMFLEEELCGRQFKKHDPKKTNWGSVAIVNECNEQLDNAKKLKDFKFPCDLKTVIILSTFASRYMEGQLSKGMYKSSLKEMNEKLVSNTKNQKILGIEGPHFLYHKNTKDLAKKIINIAKDFSKNKVNTSNNPRLPQQRVKKNTYIILDKIKKYNIYKYNKLFKGIENNL